MRTERNFPLRFLLMQRKAPAKRPETLEHPGSAPEFGMDECPIPLQIPQKKASVFTTVPCFFCKQQVQLASASV